MPRGPAIYGVKWEKFTTNGYCIQVLRDPDMEDILKEDFDIKRGIYQIQILNGDDVINLYHDFTLNDALARAKRLVDEVEKNFEPAHKEKFNPEDVL